MDTEFDEYDATPSLLRQRLAAMALALGVLVGAGFIAAQTAFTQAGTGTAPTAVTAEAVGVLVTIPGQSPKRMAVAQPVTGVKNNASGTQQSYRYPADGSLVTVRRINASGGLNAGQRTAKARASVDDVVLLEGRIRIRNAVVTSTATVAGGRASGRVGVEPGATLVIDGKATEVAANRQVVIPGVGTLAINEQALVAAAPRGDAGSGPRYRAVGSALHLRLSEPISGLPAGTDIVIGKVDAGVRQAKAKAKAAPTPAAPAPAPKAPDTHTAPPAGGPGSRGPGSTKPGEALLPRRATSVRGTGPASTGNLQGYLFPILGQTNYSNDWGAPRQNTITHQGNDLFAAEGTPVIAITDGILDRVGWNSVGGHRFWLYDAYGNAFYHAHLSAFSPLAVDGARVRAGDVIGFVGNSGDAQGTPPHVHFELHPGDNGPTNPFPFLQAWRQGVSAAAALQALGGSGRLPPLIPLDSTDVSVVSGLSDSLVKNLPQTGYRPVSEEGVSKPDAGSLKDAIASGATDSSR